MDRGIKSISTGPKNGPDAAVPNSEAAAQTVPNVMGALRIGDLQGQVRKSTHLQGEPHVPGSLE
jgi:hypothetical protein